MLRGRYVLCQTGWGGGAKGERGRKGESAIKFQAAMICRKMPLWPCKLRREQREAATVIIPVYHENNDDNKLDYCSTFCQSLKGQCHDISNPYFFLTIFSGSLKSGVKQIREDNRSQSSKFACPRTVNDYVNREFELSITPNFKFIAIGYINTTKYIFSPDCSFKSQ